MKINVRSLKQSGLKVLTGSHANDLLSSVLSIILALLVSAVMILLMGKSPIDAYGALFSGAFGSFNALINTLGKSIPLIFTGLGVGLAFRSGMLNIGVEGQLTLGAFVSVALALKFGNLPAFVLLPLVILGGMAAGGALSGVAGFLKVKMGLNEVIVTLMLNYLAILFTTFMVNGPYKSEGMMPQTDVVPGGAVLQKLFPGMQLTSSIFIAVIVAIIVYVLLWKTSFGFEIRAVGQNATAAQSGGIHVSRNIILTMVLSGAVASLAGVTEVLGTYERFILNFSPGFGFTGIAVAVLGRNHPVGIILTALLFGALDAGALSMSMRTSISASVISVIQGLVILFVAMPRILSIIRSKGV